MKNTKQIAIYAAVLTLLVTATSNAQAPKPDSKTLAATGILERLAERSGVYGVPPTAKVPGFIADAGWPQKLPNNWIIGQVGGLYVAPDDHIWIYQRPRTLTNDEAALTTATDKSKDGKPVDVLGFRAHMAYLAIAACRRRRSWNSIPTASCCARGAARPIPISARRRKAASGRPPSTAFSSTTTASSISAATTPMANPNGSAWASNNGADGMILKFTKDGKFVMMIGGSGAKGPDSNNKDGGRNGTPLFYLPADITVDPTTNRMYVSDGYGNRRVVIVDAATGKYIGHFGAYGNNPIDDKAAAAAGDWMNDFNKGNMKPAFFRNPVHCVKISKEGLIYVCDRGNNRVQVFNGRDPNLGKECANPTGEAGKCGFVKEQFVAVKTNGLPGSAVSMNFSTDAKQSCLYVGDNSNMTMYVLKRDTLEELGRLGRSGRETGEFHWLHQVSLDSHGNMYTAEVDTGKRIQKFIRFGKRAAAAPAARPSAECCRSST